MFLMGPLDGVPTVPEPSPNLTPSPLGDLSEFLFPAAEEFRTISWNIDEPLRNEVTLLPTESVKVNDVEFGEVFTDIDDLLNMNGSVTYQQVTSDEVCDILPVIVTNEDITVPQSVELLTISLPELDQPSTSSYGEPDHNYSTIKKRKRKISEISDCSETIYTGDDNKLTKYLERRRKNNIASKRSRETRKSKFLSMDEQADELERSNTELRQRIEQLESLTKRMKEALVAKLSAAN